MRSSCLLVLVICACSRQTPAPAPAPAAAPAPKAQTKTLDAPTDLASLAARLRYEAAHRPASGPHAEQVLDAIGGAGLAVLQRRQYLGLAMHASYCAGGTTRDGLAISVCEYGSADAATAGKTYADRQFAAMSDARRATHGNALLTVAGPAPAAERALHVFTTL
jgi:hypothetical protein